MEVNNHNYEVPTADQVAPYFGSTIVRKIALNDRISEH